MGKDRPKSEGLTGQDRLDFIADMTSHMLEEIKRGVAIFVLLSFKNDSERDSMQCSNAAVHVSPEPHDDRMEEVVMDIVRKFMDAHAPRWSQ